MNNSILVANNTMLAVILKKVNLSNSFVNNMHKVGSLDEPFCVTDADAGGEGMKDLDSTDSSGDKCWFSFSEWSGMMKVVTKFVYVSISMYIIYIW